jgi:putative ABC transport system permease protein
MNALREWIHRLFGSLRQGRRDKELEQELQLHLELAAEHARKRGHSPDDARRAARIQLGNVSQAMEDLRDQRGLPWLDALTSDVRFGWRQLNKHRAVSLAAILSLGLAIGATTAAFRLVDAVLLRPLPVADPGRLFVVAFTEHDPQNRLETRDDFDYPTYRQYTNVIGDRADLLVIGTTARQDIIVGNSEPEKAFRQFLSGNVFPSFGLRPALGRLLVPADDAAPGSHPVAVLSYDYWTRRFGRDPQAVGQSLRLGPQAYEVIGVAPRGFIGTEPGRMADVFVPATMNVQALNSPGWSWFRLWVRPKPGVAPSEIQQLLQTAFTEEHQQRAKTLPGETPRDSIDAYLKERIELLPAGSGASGMQTTFRRPLMILGGLVVLVLLIACANVANLLIAQAMTRGREMALRVSIGADRWRLIRLLLIESALLAVLATIVGTIFGWWSAPFIISMLAPAEDPVRMVLDPDWRALAFAIALTTVVTGLFGLAPAVRASSFTPITALKGGSDPRGHRRLMDALIGAQMAFCVFVLFIAALFVATFTRLLNQPLGFSHDHALVIDTEARGRPEPTESWMQIVDNLRQVPGVQAAAIASWALLSENRWSGTIFIPGRPPETRPAYFLETAPGFFDAMQIGMVQGRDFRSGDPAPQVDQQNQPIAGLAIVNEAFARVYFDGQNPVGQKVSIRPRNIVYAPVEIVGLVRDAAYFAVREPMRPTLYVPLGPRNNASLIVRTSGDPLMLAATLRQQIATLRPDLRIQVGRMSGLVSRQMLRERLLATLSSFFAVVALLLASIGLYGVLNYGVVQRRREIGVRMALGARAVHVARGVTREMVLIVTVGAVIGLAGGLGFGRVVERLLFQVRAVDPLVVLAPLCALAAAAAVAALPPILRAVRIDPAQTLRAE